MPPESLLKLFRPRGRLSVTDLVAPSWCEFKFDYSLRGKRYRGAKMDDVIVSKFGKAIPVEKTIVIKSEKVMKQGEAVHKKLEQMLPVVEVVVKVKTAEERFALQLLNMIANLQMIADIGTCREFHVMGFVNGVYVTGIIDEINRKSLDGNEPTDDPSHSPSTSKRPSDYAQRTPRKKSKKKVDDPKQPKINSFFPVTPSKSWPPPPTEDIDIEMLSASHSPVASQEAKTVPGPPPSIPIPPIPIALYRLHLNDTKTRSVRSMPKEDMSGRLQLMLYHRLLERLVSPPDSPEAFSFPQLFAHLHLDPKVQFSDDFIAEAAQLLSGWDALTSNDLARCLDDLVACWYETIRSLDLQPREGDLEGPIDPTLELVYRSRHVRRKNKSKGKGKAKVKRTSRKDEDPFEVGAGKHWTEQPAGLTEEQQIQLAIAESLKVKRKTEIGAKGETSAVRPLSPPALDGSTSDDSGSASPIPEQVAEALDQDAAVVASQNSEMEWDKAFGDTTVQTEEVLSVGMPSLSAKGFGAVDGGDRAKSPSAGSAMIIDGESQEMKEVVILDARLDPFVSNDGAPENPIAIAESSPAKASSEEYESDSSSIIGITQFQFDAAVLDSYLEAALDFWEGRREPRGVELEETWKCNVCEYRDGCEWREAKAIEVVSSTRRKRTT